MMIDASGDFRISLKKTWFEFKATGFGPFPFGSCFELPLLVSPSLSRALSHPGCGSRTILDISVVSLMVGSWRLIIASMGRSGKTYGLLGTGGRCSATGHRHIILAGRDAEGQFRTRRAQAYPAPLCRFLASALLGHLTELHFVEHKCVVGVGAIVTARSLNDPAPHLPRTASFTVSLVVHVMTESS
eukprot:6633163-Pyramimonas_sp.AAC.1